MNGGIMNEWIGQVLPFWKDLTETEKQMLLTHTALEEYEKGVLLHIDGGDCAGVQIVKEGQVRVYITSPSGGEITLYRLVEGDVSILSASCMIKGMDISLDMMMESDTVLYTIPKEIYKKLNDTNTAVKDYTMEMVSERFSDVMWLFNMYFLMQRLVWPGQSWNIWHWRVRRNFLLLTMYLQEIWERQEKLSQDCSNSFRQKGM